MKLAPIPFDEAQRLDAVYRLNILDSKSEERFDRLTRLTRYMFDVSSAFITLVDNDRVWFKSKAGCEADEEPRDVSFCGHAICNVITDKLSSRLFEVIDAKEDFRFKDNTFIIDESKLLYYMGFVLQSVDQRNIGTLCITDFRPRSFSIEEKYLFIDLGMLAEKELRQTYFASVTENNSIESENTNKLLDLTSKLRIVQNRLEDRLKKIGVNFNEWCVLNAIMELDYATPILLSKKLNISPSLITQRLDKLEIKNLINRWHSKDGDRRFVHLTCNDHGIKLWKKGITEAIKLEKVHLKDIIYLN